MHMSTWLLPTITQRYQLSASSLQDSSVPSKIVTLFKEMFAKCGILQTLRKGTRPWYTNSTCSRFISKWSFKHNTSNSLYTHSSSFKESMVKVVKHIATYQAPDRICTPCYWHTEACQFCHTCHLQGRCHFDNTSTWPFLLTFTALNQLYRMCVVARMSKGTAYLHLHLPWQLLLLHLQMWDLIDNNMPACEATMHLIRVATHMTPTLTHASAHPSIEMCPHCHSGKHHTNAQQPSVPWISNITTEASKHLID